jgi:DNA-binding response OmpR family regulator
VDVISMDHEMPVMNGSAATSRLRQLGVTCAIIGASGNALDRDQTAFRASGLNELFSKPVDARAFLGYIRTNLAARSTIVPPAATGDHHPGAVLPGDAANPAPAGTAPAADRDRR